jgi:hypothetical protein
MKLSENFKRQEYSLRVASEDRIYVQRWDQQNFQKNKNRACVLENPWGLKGKTTYLNCEYVWRPRADKWLSFACFLALMSSSENAQAQQNGNGRRRSAQSTIGATYYIRHGQQNLTFHNLTFFSSHRTFSYSVDDRKLLHTLWSTKSYLLQFYFFSSHCTFFLPTIMYSVFLEGQKLPVVMYCFRKLKRVQMKLDTRREDVLN